MAYQHIKVPTNGEKITLGANQTLKVPDRPIIPFIEGDGTGPDIWRASQYVFDNAVKKIYGGKRQIAWMEVYAGDKPFKNWKTWLPDETVEAFREFLVGIKGPLTTPIGGGIRSLNVALRQMLDLYVCLRPVRYFAGVPSPVKHPEKLDAVIFRENTEDIYAGIEWPAESPEAKKLIKFLLEEMGVKNMRFPNTSGIGIKPISREGSERLIRAALDYAIKHKRKSVTFVHKGNIMKYTEGAFRDWGYELVKREYKGKAVGWDDCNGKPPAGQMLVKDAIADITLQQVLTRADEFERHRHDELERRLSLRCARGAGRRTRNRSRRQHQLRHRPRDLRGDPWHRAQVRRPGQSQSGLGYPVGCDDVRAPGMAGSCRRDRSRPGEDHRQERGDLRLRAADDRREAAQVLGVRQGDRG